MPKLDHIIFLHFDNFIGFKLQNTERSLLMAYRPDCQMQHFRTTWITFLFLLYSYLWQERWQKFEF